MASNISKVFEDKIAEVKAKRDEEIKKLKIQQQAALCREKEKIRKARTHRLIQFGAIIEKRFGVSFNEKADMEAWVDELFNLAKPNTRGIVPEAQNQPTENEKTCPKCGSPLRKKHGQYGEFWGCSSHPACTYSEKI